jgi:hypothetical protein
MFASLAGVFFVVAAGFIPLAAFLAFSHHSARVAAHDEVFRSCPPGYRPTRTNGYPDFSGCIVTATKRRAAHTVVCDSAFLKWINGEENASCAKAAGRRIDTAGVVGIAGLVAFATATWFLVGATWPKKPAVTRPTKTRPVSAAS